MAAPRPEPGQTLIEAGIVPTPPGTYLAEFVLPHMAATVAQAARAMHMPEQRLRAIIDSRQTVTPEIAAALSAYTRLSAGFWMNLQAGADRARRAEA